MCLAGFENHITPTLQMYRGPKSKNTRKFYAVKSGKRPGIYRSWDECKVNVQGVSDAQYKSFPTFAQADAYIRGEQPMPASRASRFGDKKAQAAERVEQRLARIKGELIAFTDGSTLHNGQEESLRRAGVGVWFGHDEHPLNVSEPFDRLPLTNQRTEIWAIVRALDAVLGSQDAAHASRPLYIVSDSQYSINCAT